jgi:anaerobic selenocysteine-containing dehydrogenase
MNFPAELPEMVGDQPAKAWFGAAANKDNDFAYDWMPKRDGAYDVLAMFENMHQGKMNGFICQGFNPLAAVPNKKKLGTALSKLKYLVIMDPLQTETGEFWKNYGEYNNVDPAQDRHRSVPPARVVLCRRPGLVHQFEPPGAVARPRGRAPGRGQD